MLDVLFFFFQAEDGIRDRSPSRGLGDVYKRQAHDLPRLQIVFINVQGLKYGSHSTGQEFISLLYNNNLGAKQFTLDLKQFLKSD